MALATRCPHCSTTFRVAQDQLKLRAGLVRCGACREIFNGAEHLIQSDKPAQSGTPPASAAAATQAVPSPAATPDAPVAPPAPDASSESTSSSPASAASEHASSPAAPSAGPALPTAAPVMAPVKPATPADSVNPQTPTIARPSASMPKPPVPVVAANDPQDDPMQRMTLMDFTSFDESGEDNPVRRHVKKSILSGAYGLDRLSQSEESPDSPAPDELTKAIDELQRKPWRIAKKSASPDDVDPDGIDADEPEFVKRARRRQTGSRARRIFMGGGSAVLLVALIAQGLYTFRNQIAAHLPATAPALASACAVLGCRIELLAQIDAVSIESSELQALATSQNSFLLTTVLRNRSATAQQWPNIELTLNDANDKAVARRVFTPRDYLPRGVDVAKGFAANMEQTSKLTFVLSELSASGYRVELFYP
jgi:predicted Zn finger-like uncharacterized protein